MQRAALAVLAIVVSCWWLKHSLCKWLPAMGALNSGYELLKSWLLRSLPVSRSALLSPSGIASYNRQDSRLNSFSVQNENARPQ